MPATVPAGIGTFLLALSVDGSFAKALRQRNLLNLFAEEVFNLLETIDVCLTNEA